MILNVCDLEMNQPSNSIIQIGACQLDVKSGKVGSHFSRFINLGDERLDPRIIELTGISQEQVDDGVTLSAALFDFWNWVGSRNLAAWGGDVDLLMDASDAIDLTVPDHLVLLDLKAMGSVMRCAFPASRSRGGLLDTMHLFGLEFEGRHHNALDDAINTARLVALWVDHMTAFRKVKELVG